MQSQNKPNIFLLRPDNHINKEDFIGFWSNLYDYKNKSVYDEIVGRKILTAKDIQRIYEWKNNMGKDQNKMSGKKQQFVNGVIEQLHLVNTLKNHFELDIYRKNFDHLSTVWGSLLLHLIQPEYPIYDQHVHRAFALLTGHEVNKVPATKKAAHRMYYDTYVPFYRDFSKGSTISPKTIDDALWAFGKFLSRYPLISPTN